MSHIDRQILTLQRGGNGAAGGKDVTCIEKKRRSAEGKPAERLTGRAVWDWQCCNRSGIFTPLSVHMCTPGLEPLGNYVQCRHIKGKKKLCFSWWWMKDVDYDYYAMTVIYNVRGVWLSRILSSRVVAALTLRNLTAHMTAGFFRGEADHCCPCCYSLEAVDSLCWIGILAFVIFKNFDPWVLCIYVCLVK